MTVSQKTELYGIFENKAGYMATPVACGWAGAVIVVNRSFRQGQ